MPCYNASVFLAEAIESILQQTFQNWELVIVDDCSTDTSYSIAQSYAERDSRIRLHQLEKNSGSCKLPRDTAVSLSRGQWVIKFDADDYVQADLLEKLLQRQRETGAEIVCARMVFFDDKNPCLCTCPGDDFDSTATFSGDAAVALTLNGWKIGFAGALVKKNLWEGCSEFLSTSFLHQSADEYAEREILANAKLVAYVQADYMYRQVPGSISHNNSHSWEWLLTDQKLTVLTKQKFGSESTSFKLAKLAYIERLHFLLRIEMKGALIPPLIQEMIRNLSLYDVLTMADTPLSKRIKYFRHFRTWKRKFLKTI